MSMFRRPHVNAATERRLAAAHAENADEEAAIEHWKETRTRRSSRRADFMTKAQRELDDALLAVGVSQAAREAARS